MSDHASRHIEILPVRGIGELRPGDDLAELIASTRPLHDGDVLVVTSKAVSKTEGRLIVLDTADEDAREAARQEAIDAETMRLVARRDELRIVQTRHGLVLAAAGVDVSNVARNELALLPVDPDASAQLLRERLRELLGVDVGVIISDSMGRPWRTGITDTAIGVAGRDRRDRPARAHRRVRQHPRRHPGGDRRRARGGRRPRQGQARRRAGGDRARLRAATASSTTTAWAAAR